jgi:hypothetical protein
LLWIEPATHRHTSHFPSLTSQLRPLTSNLLPLTSDLRPLTSHLTEHINIKHDVNSSPSKISSSLHTSCCSMKHRSERTPIVHGRCVLNIWTYEHMNIWKMTDGHMRYEVWEEKNKN